MNEPRRLRMLQAQKGKRREVPSAIRYLMLHGDVLVPETAEEALAVLDATRREVRVTGSPEASERLFALAVACAKHLELGQKPDRARVELEAAVDAVVLPRQRQILLAELTRVAVRQGWWELALQYADRCDPHSTNLEADTAYRIARGLAETARGDFDAVVMVLNATTPIHDEHKLEALVLWCNALERLGSRDTPRRHLQQQLSSRRHDVEAVVSRYPGLALCTRSLAAAQQAIDYRKAVRDALDVEHAKAVKVGSLVVGCTLMLLVGLTAALGVVSLRTLVAGVVVFGIGTTVVVAALGSATNGTERRLRGSSGDDCIHDDND